MVELVSLESLPKDSTTLFLVNLLLN